ncbi:MAG: VOC family protein, partial [Myxococcota bacterium]|nr:VOC family protein [Myxococcota bacterium]
QTADEHQPLTLNHLAIKSKQLEELAEFYIKVLELPLLKTFTDESGLRSIWLSLGTSILMIERSDYNEREASTPTEFSADKPGYHLLAFTVSAEKQNALRGSLHDFEIKIEHETEYTIYFRDPDGNRIGLSTLDVNSVKN